MQLITVDNAVQFGLTLQKSLKTLAQTHEVEKLHGDTVASLHRIAALQDFRAQLSGDVAKALILSAAGESYEVAESENYKIPDQVKIAGAIKAMTMGCLLADEAGPHFTIIMGKGGMSVLIKEAGHRHKLKRSGAKKVDVKAAAVRKEKSETNDKKWEMLIHGEASCELDGELIKVERTGDFPIKLPCYESDGPDGHEAKARRRLLRDLWAKVSGEFDPIELSEVADDDGRRVVVTTPAAIESHAPMVTQNQQSLSFDEQIEAATKARELDTIARAIGAANLPPDQFEWYKGMVTEARERLKAKA